MINASILTIGDELLIGQVVDTNSAWMAQELNKAGIWVRRRISVGDDAKEILQALDDASAGSDIVLMTGGLGPTDDDITKGVLCNYFGGKLVVDPGALANVKYIFEQVLRRPMIERNLKQAEVPDNCTVIQNKRGTAPGMWFEKDGRVFISMPGVPYEMKGMMADDILPALKSRFSLSAVVHRVLLTAGVGESFLAEHIREFERDLPAHIRLAYLPNYGMLRLRLTAIGDNKELLEKSMEDRLDDLKQRVSEWLVADEDIALQEALGNLLTEKGRTLSTAESCTGGYMAHLITSVPGSSNYFKGSIISYANEAKENILGVNRETLAAEGAVSEATVRQMAAGAIRVLKTDYAIASSGIMGPGGGSSDKPVGTVWLAAGNAREMIAQKFFYRFDRHRNIELAANAGLNMLRKFIRDQE